MNIAIWGINPPDKYSGGRIHAWTIAEALAYNGHVVDYYTNYKPYFFDDFNGYKKHKSINLIINLFFQSSREKIYDLIFVIPHFLTYKSFLIDRFIFYKKIIDQKKANSLSKIIFLDFESPSWINEMLPNVRPYYKYRYSDRIIKNVDLILSTTKIGTVYAKEYYSKFNENLKFEQLYLSINNLVADEWINENKKNVAVFFGRFNQKHKNSGSILNIIQSLPEGFNLSVIGSSALIAKEMLNNINKISEIRKIKVRFSYRIRDLEKFKLLSQAKILFFSSNFEGYGIPPVEAQYVNTPVICSDIPVLREVNKYAEFDDFTNSEILKHKVQSLLKKRYFPNQLHNAVKSFAKFENFAHGLQNIVMGL